MDSSISLLFINAFCPYLLIFITAEDTGFFNENKKSN